MTNLLDAFSTASGLDDKPYTEDQAYIAFDEKRCIDCWACEVACKQWHETASGEHARCWINEEITGDFPKINRRFSFIHCLHCQEPECLKACPTGAITKRAEDGVVLVDEATCINCKKCFNACPYSIPEFTGSHMYKCDMCTSIAELTNGVPKCVATCPTQALVYHPAQGAQGTQGGEDYLQVHAKSAAALTTQQLSGAGSSKSAGSFEASEDAPVLEPEAAQELSHAYRLLGSLLLFEPTVELLQSLVDAPSDAPKAWQSYATELAGKIQSGSTSIDDEAVDLAAEFARVLLGMSANPVIPYESVYVDANGLLMGNARDEVVRAYASAGFQEFDGLRLPEDHLGIELTFMADLCNTEAQAEENGDSAQESAKVAANIKRSFLNEHLKTWVPRFSEDLKQRTRSDFYRGLADMIASAIVD